MTILFVGESNAARSPIAEAIARQLAPRHEVWSAGWRPSHVRPEVREVLAEEGIRAEGLRARSIGEVPLDEVDVVVALCPDEGRLRVRSDVRRLDWRLPDPTSAPPHERIEAFRASRDELARRVGALLRELG